MMCLASPRFVGEPIFFFRVFVRFDIWRALQKLDGRRRTR